MADSNITKRALATALKELMEEQPLAKIRVADICERCGMNRKSFYYHFKDKYDLVNWIYDIEFVTVVKQKTYQSDLEFLEDLCRYFYENKSFYRKALKVKEQNSFSEHFHEMLKPILREELKKILGESEITELQVVCMADIVVGTIEHWLMEKECLPVDEFLEMMKTGIKKMAVVVCEELDE